MNFRFMKKNLFQTTTIFVIVALLSINLAMSMSTLTMRVNRDGQMTGCIFNGMAEVCTMSPQEHLASWQTLLAAIPVKTAISILALLLISIVLVYFLIESLSDNLPNLKFKKQKLYSNFQKGFSFLIPLQKAFSQGILNTKRH